jgi:hypothetical protein
MHEYQQRGSSIPDTCFLEAEIEMILKKLFF